MMWMSLSAQQVSVDIQESAGNCLLESNCETNSLCYDLVLEIDEPGWQLRSYNIWVRYPSQSQLNYNSDNSCVGQNGGDTDNSQNGQYRLGAVNGTYMIEENTRNTIHSFCLDYVNANLIKDSLISVGGTAFVYGFPFESTITLRNTQNGEIKGLRIQDVNTLQIEVDDKHSLMVNNGWSGISTFMEPNVTDIEEIMAPFIDDLALMYNLTEGIYSPGNNVNTMVNWNYKSGYIIKAKDEFILNICGNKPQNKSINLMSGWNVIPVLADDNIPVESVFGELGENLVIVKEIAGYRIYYPEFGINTLSSLEPGKAYFVRVVQADQIVFPEQDNKSTNYNQTYNFEANSPWGLVNKTPESHVFCFTERAISSFKPGDLIGAFDHQGLCTGVMEIGDERSAFAVSVFGDDNTSERKDGMNEGEKVSFILERASTGEMLNLDITYADDSPFGDEFTSNGISIVKEVTINTTGTSNTNFLTGHLLQIYPNPTRGKTHVEITGDAMIDGKIEITDARGQLILETDHFHKGGTSLHEFDFSETKPGVYYLRFYSENYNNTQKIVVK